MPIARSEIQYLPGSMEPEDIPLCPCCDQPIEDWESFCVAEGSGALCLAHVGCIEESD